MNMMMKRILTFSLALVLMATLSGCDQQEAIYRSPKKVAKVFAENLYSGHFDEAKAYVTQESVTMVNFLQSAFPPDNFENCNEVKAEDVKLTSTSDTTAICTYMMHLCNGKTHEETVNVVKVNGHWLVSLRNHDNPNVLPPADRVEHM